MSSLYRGREYRRAGADEHVIAFNNMCHLKRFAELRADVPEILRFLDQNTLVGEFYPCNMRLCYMCCEWMTCMLVF
jgi:hypothetical protein